MSDFTRFTSNSKIKQISKPAMDQRGAPNCIAGDSGADLVARGRAYTRPVKRRSPGA